jgi:hypothetical protein
MLHYNKEWGDMDEKQFLAQIQSKLRLVLGAISNPPEPLKVAAGMVLFRRIDEREFLSGSRMKSTRPQPKSLSIRRWKKSPR